MTWDYRAESVAGNFYEATRWLSIYHPEWDVVAMSLAGNYTIIAYRIPRKDLGV